MNRECMNVVYASNDGYARHLGTSLYSLLDRNRDFADISVYVLTLGLSEENQGKLREIAEHFGRRLIFLNGSLLIKELLPSLLRALYVPRRLGVRILRPAGVRRTFAAKFLYILRL